MRDLYFYDLDPGVYTIKAVYKTVSMEHQGEYEIQYDVDIKKNHAFWSMKQLLLY